MISIKERQIKEVCCVEIFKVSESDSKVGVSSEGSTSVMGGGVRTRSFNVTDLKTHLRDFTLGSTANL